MDSTGKLVSYKTTFDKEGDAKRYAASIETDKARGRFVDPRLGQLLLAEWVEQSWAATTNLRPSTRARPC